MEWDRIERNWAHFKGNARRHWGRLSDAQLEHIEGKRERLAASLQQAYGVSSNMAEKQLAEWQNAQKNKSPFK
jgi:uncharacterized protein YjbJ (UPF0337 family)